MGLIFFFFSFFFALHRQTPLFDSISFDNLVLNIVVWMTNEAMEIKWIGAVFAVKLVANVEKYVRNCGYRLL